MEEVTRRCIYIYMCVCGWNYLCVYDFVSDSSMYVMDIQ